MRVLVNGKPREVRAGVTVQQFVEQQGLALQRVLVERNGEPLRRELFAATPLHDGDQLEIAQMVGGG